MLLPCQTKNVTSQNECVTTIPKVTHGNIVSKFTFLAILEKSELNPDWGWVRISLFPLKYRGVIDS